MLPEKARLLLLNSRFEKNQYIYKYEFNNNYKLFFVIHCNYVIACCYCTSNILSMNRYWGSDKTGPGTRLKWDYCVPSELPLNPHFNPSTGRPPYNKGNLPISNDVEQVITKKNKCSSIV